MAFTKKERERLTIPAAKDEAAKLARRYTSDALGNFTVDQQGANTVFLFRGWKSAVISRKNDDGTISFITIDASRRGIEFVEAEREGKRAPIIRDGQHEYLFHEAA